MADPLNEAFVALWEADGSASTRMLAQEIGVSHTTVAEMLRGSRVPSEKTYRRVVEGLNGDWATFAELYPTKTTDTGPTVQTQIPLVSDQ